MRTLTLLFLLACKGKTPPTVAAPTVERSTDPRSAGVRDPRLAALLGEHWDGMMRRFPTWATALGDHRFDGDAPDSSAAAEDAWEAQLADWTKRLKALDRLDAADAVTRDLLVTELEGELGKSICEYGAWSFSPRSNPMLDGNDTGERFRIETVQDSVNLVRRVEGLARDVHVQARRIQDGAARGLVANRPSTELVIQQVRDQLAMPLEEQPLMAPRERIPSGFTPAEAESFRNGLTTAARHWLEAMEVWVTTLEADVLPIARVDGEGILGIPNGLECYDAMIRSHTTLPLSADEVHATGLAEIQRLHAEVAELGRQSLGVDDVQAIFERLRTDPQLYFETEDQVEAKAREALARAKAAIPDWFGRLPETDCVVDRVPPYEAPYTTIAYYRQAVPGERPGAYVVNT
ncbi:MAG: DUF885 domain-containing protein, partial [Myxococcales bacterium]|nr:DUF885 domain-containing protein [Myxococcales bacterium]